MALVHVLAGLRRKLHHTLVVHGVDHGLRAEAAAELALARELAESLSVPFTVTRVAVEPGSNLQARARAARLDALSAAAAREGAASIATGHTADDRAETFLLRMLRGAGPRGLAVLPAKAPLPAPGGGAAVLIRPLLQARRIDVMAHLERHRLPSALDPSNVDPRFLRARVRRELVPLLEDLSPGIVPHLCALAEMMAEGWAPDLGLPGGDPIAGPGSGADPLAGLGRAQRQAVAHARHRGKSSVTLRVRGGREISISLHNEPPPRTRGPR